MEAVRHFSVLLDKSCNFFFLNKNMKKNTWQFLLREIDSESLPLGRDFDMYALPHGREFDMSAILEQGENLEMSYPQPSLVFPVFLDTMGEK